MYGEHTQPAGAPVKTAHAEPRIGPFSRRTVLWMALMTFVLAMAAAVIIQRARNAAGTVEYLTATAAEGPITKTVTATGTVNPVLTIIVGSYVSGVIQSISCDFNTQVKKGQICAEIDPRPYQTAVDSATAELKNAKAQLIKDQAALAYAKATYLRDKTLVQPGYVTKDALDAAHSSYDGAVAQVQLDGALIASREAALRAAVVNLGYTDIVSPVNGTVVSRNVTIGQTVAASFQTPTLFLIATDMTSMQVDTNVSESDIGGIRVGQTASFHVESFPNRPFEATVVQVRQAPQTVQNVVTYDVVLGVDNKQLLLKPGMTATARITIDARRQVLRVPDQALRFVPANTPTQPGQPPQVWKLVDKQAVAVPVTLGLDDDSFSEVLGGNLKPGDVLIIGARRDAAGANPTPRLNL